MVSHTVAVLLAVGAGVMFVRGARLAARALGRPEDPSAALWLIRGIRGIVVGVGAAALAGGMLFGATWLLVFGAVFLAEEIYETGVVALILRMSRP